MITGSGIKFNGEPDLQTLENFVQYGILCDMAHTTGDWEIGTPSLEEWILNPDESALDEGTLTAKLVFMNISDEGDDLANPRKKVFKVTINVKEVDQ